MSRLAMLIAAWACLSLGAVTLPLPTPTGLILIAIGAALLLTVSRRARRIAQRLRARWPGLDARLIHVERRLPPSLRTALAATRVHPATGPDDARQIKNL